MFHPGTPDGPVPVPLVQAVIEVLGDWRPEAAGIAYVESARRAILTRDFADGLAVQRVVDAAVESADAGGIQVPLTRVAVD